MRTSLLLLILLTLSTGQAQTLPTSPWPDGEKLTYLIEYGPLDAAEAIFTASARPAAALTKARTTRRTGLPCASSNARQ